MIIQGKYIMSTSSIPNNDIDWEKQDWLDSIDFIYREYGASGVREILRSLQNHTLNLNIPLNEATLNTPYVNTISVPEQPPYPGDIELEKRIENIIRWNAMAMVLQAQDAGTGVGGHIATYASAATQLEVGFNHFFRASDNNYSGDMIIPQPHAAPGIYARAYLEGRISEEQMKNFRRELGEGGGLCSYPHPRSMPTFWQLPGASMGLSTPMAIYQARFSKYLENRGLKSKASGKTWLYIGDGEADEPEVLGTLNMASREKLNNIVMVVNCNLQRLDGPVRGNGKIIQELERSYRGADWNVIKVIWGSGWDTLLAQDSKGILRNRMEEAVDGDYQYYSVSPGNVVREHWVENNPELEKMMNSLNDEEIKNIKRGGQDPKKIFAAYQRAANSDKPTVILIKTVKGDGMGVKAQGRNNAHQKKNLSTEERVQIAREYGIPIDEEAASRADFYKPAEDSEEYKYLQSKREALGGYLPSRETTYPTIETPELSAFSEFLKGSGERTASTTSAVVRMLTRLLKDKKIGKYVVPIVPDEARTFGMDGLFNVAGIYSPDGQKYTPVDADSLMSYREAQDGQILQEGICEAGAMASFVAAGSAYAVHGVPMIPFYIFYSMFGFQRVGDMIWASGDMMCRGFLLGGTAGRTTLNGEGLQHEDGHSHVLASTIPNLISYDPAFSYELAVIIQNGIYRMYEKQENIFYYITVYNENYSMPAIPEQKSTEVEQGILKGGYCFQHSGSHDKTTINLLSSGSIMQQALSASVQLTELGYKVNIWSITSFIELEREALDCERWNRLNSQETPRQPYIEQLFAEQEGVFIAVTDYVKNLANTIGRWIPGQYQVLGTDGYGISEAKPELRDYFEIGPDNIIQASITALYNAGQIDKKELKKRLSTLNVNPDKTNPRLA